MNTKLYLENIHKNLQVSTNDLNNRWSKIFLEYQLKIQTEGSEAGEEYLALHMGELDVEFQSYYVYFADFLQKNGLTEASEIMKRMGERFLTSLKNYKVSRASEVVNKAVAVTEELSKNFKGIKNN
jgi:hypothetical protein